jgi:hypothetical protein
MKKETKSYLGGLIDGEGCLRIAFGKRKGYFERKSLYFNFYIGLQERDGWILENLQKETKMGKIYKVKDRDKFHIRWQMVNMRETVEMLKQIIPYLRLKQKMGRKMLKILLLWIKTEESVKGKRVKGSTTRPIKVIRSVEKLLG